MAPGGERYRSGGLANKRLRGSLGGVLVPGGTGGWEGRAARFGGRRFCRDRLGAARGGGTRV